jgi:ABC-2 type transport system permease protein
MRNILIIARRDLRAQFNSPVAYVVLGGTMLLLGALFFKAPHISVGSASVNAFWDTDRATMDQMFTLLPIFITLLVIPAVTMRSLAAEKGSGTLELLITMPVSDVEVILGKYLAICVMTLVLLAATALYPICMFWLPWNLGWHLGALDPGPVWAGYLGCIFLSFSAAAVGLMYSSLTESDVIAFFLTLATFAALYGISWFASNWHGGFADAVDFVSFQARFQPFARGIIDTRALVYFASIAILCLLVCFRSLESRKWS